MLDNQPQPQLQQALPSTHPLQPFDLHDLRIKATEVHLLVTHAIANRQVSLDWREEEIRMLLVQAENSSLRVAELLREAETMERR